MSLKKKYIEPSYEWDTIERYRERLDKKFNLVKTNNLGTRDQHLEIIISQLLELIDWLSFRIQCMASQMHIHIDQFEE